MSNYYREIVSDCCGAEPVGVSDDIGICPECKDHCEYIELEECDRCGGSGTVSSGHPMDPASEDITCPECGGGPDPDEWYDHKKSTLL